MTPELKIDSNLNKILIAAGSTLANYQMPASKDRLRKAMREVMMESYTQGSNDCYKAMTEEEQ